MYIVFTVDIMQELFYLSESLDMNLSLQYVTIEFYSVSAVFVWIVYE